VVVVVLDLPIARPVEDRLPDTVARSIQDRPTARPVAPWAYSSDVKVRSTRG